MVLRRSLCSDALQRRASCSSFVSYASQNNLRCAVHCIQSAVNLISAPNIAASNGQGVTSVLRLCRTSMGNGISVQHSHASSNIHLRLYQWQSQPACVQADHHCSKDIATVLHGCCCIPSACMRTASCFIPSS